MKIPDQRQPTKSVDEIAAALLRMPDPLTQPTMTVDEVAPFYGLGRWSAYEAVRRGDIPSLRVGKRILIPTAAVRRHLGIDPPAPVETPTAS